MKVMVVLGTRPEGVKLAPVIKALQAEPTIECRVCVTGQHREMLDQVLQLFAITPDVDLDLMRAGQTPSQVAARVLLTLEPVLEEERPDWIIVQGDTTTVMAAAIAAHHLRIRVAHVEAGLRTGDRWNPFPEEMNRVVADHISDIHFAPTQQAKNNLLREGIAAHRIHVTGNTAIDALLQVIEQPVPPLIEQVLMPNKRLVLVTTHRRENLGEPQKNICRALISLSEQFPDVQILLPVHLNPRVREVIYPMLSDLPNITLIDPVDYLTLANLMKRAVLIMTDSGGIQEEAPTFHVPILILRETTERPEAVDVGFAELVGTDTTRILDAARPHLANAEQAAWLPDVQNPYGDGEASRRIVSLLSQGELA
ncbi:MAG: non-hydrolyzing UDP-N-acetylglucosamine 2-epimerase [Candidatus Promineifilaceae bacterium]